MGRMWHVSHSFVLLHHDICVRPAGDSLSVARQIVLSCNVWRTLWWESNFITKHHCVFDYNMPGRRFQNKWLENPTNKLLVLPANSVFMRNASCVKKDWYFLVFFMQLSFFKYIYITFIFMVISPVLIPLQAQSADKCHKHFKCWNRYIFFKNISYLFDSQPPGS